MRLTWKEFALAACALSAGCSSSSSGGPSCSSFSACGGNVVGTWNIKNECFSSDYNPIPNCSGATLSLSSESITGSITFNSDGTYTATDTGSANETLTIPNSCLTFSLGGDAGTVTETCAQLQSGLTMVPDGGTPNMANCTMTSTGCSCQVMTARMTSMGSGTYTTAGNTITTTGGGSGSVAYCVQGNTLTWQTQGVGGGTNTVVATK